MRGFFSLIFVFLLNYHFSLFGQEVLVGLQTMPVKNQEKSSNNSKSILSLPFFDDFAYPVSYPKAGLWTSTGVVVNQTYPINPLTIGVATFDALNSKGELYPNLSTTSSTADTLTSQPIDLSFPGDTNIYLSFYYQPKGYGKEPQTYDSLVLELFDVENSKWVRSWSVSADFQNGKITEKHILNRKTKSHTSSNLSSHFFLVHMPILEDRFKKPGFQFRFMNYASHSPNFTIPGLISNSDHWHLDLVTLEKDIFFDDTLINDVSFSMPLTSILKIYESIPWKHFNSEAKKAELTDPLQLRIVYTNLGPVIWNITRRFVIDDLSGNSLPYAFSGGAENIFPSPNNVMDYTREFLYEFNSSWEDSAKFVLKSYLITDIEEETFSRRWNDTLTYQQNFSNYYAYDDGSAENGYGLYGDGTETGMVAMKFHSYEADSLKGIMIYFNKTHQNASQQYFKLTVWDDNNGKPGNIIYQRTDVRPLFTDSLNVFTLYGVDKKIKLGGDFYVGWVQTKAEMLNVGYDLNKNNRLKLFYNITGQWVNSTFNGSLMIRPVFGKLTQNPTGIEKPGISDEISIFPNPAASEFTIQFNGNSNRCYVRVISMTGQILINNANINEPIPLQNINSGLYIVQLINSDGVVLSRKLLVTK